jgi:Protein of unknown function (DUF1194)
MPILELLGRVIAVGLVIVGCCPGSARAADIAVALELVLAVDVSGSVDAREFDLQQGGIVRAFRDPEVIEAISSATPEGIAVTVVQWAGKKQQHTSIDWTLVSDEASALAFAARIDAAARLAVGETAIAEALGFAIARFEQNRFAGARRAIDISGDGVTNAALAPDSVRDAAAAAGITVNGLAILTDTPGLWRYYAEHVVGGPGAFVMVAENYRDFAEAMRLKLLQEIRGGPISGQPPPHRFAAIAVR